MVRVAPRQKLYGLIKQYPDTFFSHGGWTERNLSIGVKLGPADAALMKELVIDSWKHVAPKRALKNLSESGR